MASDAQDSNSKKKKNNKNGGKETTKNKEKNANKKGPSVSIEQQQFINNRLLTTFNQ